ncbi:MAG TPA: NADH-quinone oxidoreductase subunit L, partial [Verrucomicrobiae bacterium]|nr:NADH-quinone oxidoreductase subunit L [Verrucomicrobiae bacterium]
MNLSVQHLWLIPAMPLVAAAILAVTSRPHRRFAAGVAIGAMAVSLVLSVIAFAPTLGKSAATNPLHEVSNFTWFQFGSSTLQLGWVLDPLSAVMLVMVSFVGLLIFIFSIGYMAHDENFTRFFCFLSLFAAAMLGLVIANNLLLMFMCWELVGLASYLLIGFWYHKPRAAAAAKKAFITTRIGDVVFFLGILYLYWQAGTLLFYDNGNGCLESAKLGEMHDLTTVGGMAVTTAIGLLIFCGAIGKSGQVPLHVWLPDAMEGPTPVSALIHAATMVAAGVFLMARVFPLLDPAVVGVTGSSSAALTVVTWVGAITAVFAACIAVMQYDIKRILAYSTVSQLGFMMLGLGVGGVAVGMFHLITHAFFKALLFLGAGSVIHGCHERQDIRTMGGLRKFMPVTFATYDVGMMALS